MAYLSCFSIKVSKQLKCELLKDYVTIKWGFIDASHFVSVTSSYSCLLRLQEENQPPEGDKEEPPGGPAAEEAKSQRSSSSENFQERRALAIAAKAQEIEKVTFHQADYF